MKISVRSELETELHRVIATWFPRSVDLEQGGFLCDFDYRWRPAGSQCKMLEYQARQTLAAAQSAAYASDPATLRSIAAHGFRYLRDVMWDRSLGGWFRLLDRHGSPQEGATKHGHGSSYAISACVACYLSTGDPECLELAKLAFSWLEEHAHDHRNGGYFVLYRRDGTPILSPDKELLPGWDRDGIGTPIGFKDINTTIDLLKCLSDLYRVWPDASVRKRLEELLCIVRDRFVVAPGVAHSYTHPDWTPLPDIVHYGHVLRAANLLIAASETLFADVDQATERVATSIIDTMLRVAWDSDKGGFFLAGTSFGRMNIENTAIFITDKYWWVQAEGMKALLGMARLHSHNGGYKAHFLHLWDYLKKHQIDARYGGWLAAGIDTNPNEARGAKATMWKDSSHEVDALVDCLLVLD
jgi:mannobiose 2-epimerase